MSVIVKEEDIIATDIQCIVHQCNCVTTYGKGLYADIAIAFPWADIYKSRPAFRVGSMHTQPGTIAISGNGISERFVIGLMAQKHPGKPSEGDTIEQRQAWFKLCLELIPRFEDIDEVAFPHGIGCGLAGGDWKVYEQMIVDFAKANPQIRVFVLKRPDKK